MWGKRHSIELMVKFAQLTSQACMYYISECGRKKVLTNTGSLCHVPQEGGNGGKIRRYSGWGGRIKNREKVLKEEGCKFLKKYRTQISPIFAINIPQLTQLRLLNLDLPARAVSQQVKTSLGFHPLWYVYKLLWPLMYFAPPPPSMSYFREHHCIINWMCLP